MKKTLLSLLLFGLLVSALQANPVDVERAKAVGIKFMNHNTAIRATEASLAYVEYANNGAACFYVFTMNPKGFVVVSADDRAKPILGYSTESGFSATDIPDGLQCFFANYQVGFSQMMAENELRTEMAVNDWRRLEATGMVNDARITREVPQLLTSIWNQSALYNRYCPVDTLGPGNHVFAGCVATAMSQIMNYWQWPRQGTGEHSYYCEPYGQLMVSFESSDYCYDLMPDYLDWTSSDVEIDAIAQLQYHAGISVEMMYNPEGSYAWSFAVPSAMINFFKYDESAQYDGLNWHYMSEWKEMLRDNLDNGMPLYYSASGPDGGHAFVCDGYDDNDMFHFNWGWQGLDNGYFTLNGFYLSFYSFTYDHGAVFGIYPNEDYWSVPKQLEGFHAEELNEGTNRISFVTPSETVGGFPISQIDTVVVMRNNEVIHREYGLPSGSEFSYDDNDALGICHYAVFHYADAFAGKVERDTVLNGSVCEMSFHLHDSVGDGWIAKSISLVDSRGIAVTRLGLSEGSEAVVTVEVPSGEEMAMHWAYTIGGKDGESYFEAYDWDGNLVYATDGKPVVGELCQFFTDCTDEVAETVENGISVFPNPARSQVTIMGADVAQVELFNIQGQKVIVGNSEVIDLTELENSIYLLRVSTTDGQVWYEKLIKE